VHPNHVRISVPVKVVLLCIGLGLEETTKWLDCDIVGCLQTFFIECTKGDFLKDPEVLNNTGTKEQTNILKLFFFFLTAQIRNLWEILSGQHRTNAMDEFVNGVKAVESEWLAVLGRTLTPVFYRKMPLRLAKKLSAGFQDKESKPQVYIILYEISMPTCL